MGRAGESTPEQDNVSFGAAKVSHRRCGGIAISTVGLTFPVNTTYEEWLRAGAQISRIVNSSAWCLGDWLVRGQDRYTDRYRRAIDEVGLDYQTLRNYAWVARRFPQKRRREQLSFQHHAEVAALPESEQDYWLNQAENGGWARNQLRRELRESRRRERGETGPMVPLPRLNVGRERIDRWRNAALREKSDFSAWLVTKLDQAAANVLTDLDSLD